MSASSETAPLPLLSLLSTPVSSFLEPASLVPRSQTAYVDSLHLSFSLLQLPTQRGYGLAPRRTRHTLAHDDVPLPKLVSFQVYLWHTRKHVVTLHEQICCRGDM